MKDTWTTKKLIEVASFQNGHAFYKDGYSEQGYHAIDLYNVDENGGLRFGSRDKYVSNTLAAKYSRFILNAGDLVIVMTDMTQAMGILGKAALIDRSDCYILNQRIGRVTADNSIITTKFLHHFINSPFFLKPLHQKAKGAVQKYVNTGDIKDNLVSFPPLPEQKRIAGILSAYDDLIENNLRRIKILEDMAQSLYREWFVHFRFPGHESTKMIDSPLGPIPEGWEVKKLGDIATDIRKSVPKGPLGEPTRYVGLEHIPRKSLALDDWDTVEELGSNKLIFKKGDILFGKIRPYFHKVSVAPFEGLCSADTIVINSKDQKHASFVTACVSSEAFVAHASATANGAKMPRANWKVLVNYELVVPTDELLHVFTSFYSQAVEKQQTLIKQNQNLRQTRDLLLPKLLSEPKTLCG